MIIEDWSLFCECCDGIGVSPFQLLETENGDVAGSIPARSIQPGRFVTACGALVAQPLEFCRAGPMAGVHGNQCAVRRKEEIRHIDADV